MSVKASVVVNWSGLVITFVGTCLLWKTFTSCKENIQSEEYFLAHLFIISNVFSLLAAHLQRPNFLIIAFGFFAAGVTDNDIALFGKRYTLVDLDFYGQLIDHPPVVEGFNSCEDYLIGGASMGYMGTGIALIAAAAILSNRWEQQDFVSRPANKAAKMIFFFMHMLFWIGGFFLLFEAPKYTITAGSFDYDDNFYFRVFIMTMIEYMILCFLIFHMAYLSFSSTLYVASALFNALAVVYLFSEFLGMKNEAEGAPSFAVTIGFAFLWLSLLLMTLLAALFQKESDLITATRSEISPFMPRSPPPYQGSEV